jgi:pyruvate/2-oxoglutarate dehydrogenase complex dihydrolipoamide dehydrogenase (E3) component
MVFDLVVIGAGPGGYVAAIRAATRPRSGRPTWGCAPH